MQVKQSNQAILRIPSGTAQQTNNRYKRTFVVKQIKQLTRNFAVYNSDPMAKT